MVPDKTELIELKHVSIVLDSQSILTDVSFSIHSGEIVAILGGNGAGKSSLVKAILGLVPFQGKILYQGQMLTRQLVASDFNYVPQVLQFDRHFPITVREILDLECAQTVGLNSSHVRECIATFDLTELMEKKVSELSGGQLQKVMITRALFSQPKILVMDEPTNNLDQSSIIIFNKLLQLLHKQGVTILIVTHNHELLHSVTGQVTMLEVKNTKVTKHVDH